jgi:hypothetical protein
VVEHAGARLLADLAETTGLEQGFGLALGGLRQHGGGHDPGRVAVDVAVMLADGGKAISDLAVLRDQPGLFGPVASDPTAWRVLAGIDDAGLARLRSARAAAREVAWAQAAETRGGLPASAVAGQPVEGLVLDIDASIDLIAHEDVLALRSAPVPAPLPRQHRAVPPVIGDRPRRDPYRLSSAHRNEAEERAA